MLQRFLNRLKFELERFVVSGPMQRLAFIAGVIGFISVVGGRLAREFGGPFKSNGDAVWWAFLRLTDPGYLGDDQGTALRVISTIVTVLGYVLFLGALIAIMTQWLNTTMARIESGLTPIAANNHVVILGYSSQTAAIVKELLVSEERVTRFLNARGAGRLTIAILSEHVDLQTVQDLRDRLGSLWRPRQIIFRTGTPLRVDHLHRVDFQHAAAILLPAHELAGDRSATPDGRTIKALVATSTSIRRTGETRLPLVVAEIVDSRRVGIAERAYDGPIEVVATDSLVARLIVQTIRHPGIATVYQELLAPLGAADVFVRAVPDMDGETVSTASRRFDEAVLVGVIRRTDDRFDAILAPDESFIIGRSDELVLIAKNHRACTPGPAAPSQLAGHPGSDDERPASRARRGPRRILVLGWSQKIPALLREVALDPPDRGQDEVDVFSTEPAAQRNAVLAGQPIPNVTVRHLEGDYASPGNLLRVDPALYDNIVFMANDRIESPHESDARTILGHLVLAEILSAGPKRPPVVVELMSEENVALLAGHDSETLVSPVVLSHILTQVALRRDMNAVYTDLFGSGGTELGLRRARDYGFDGRDVSFADVKAATARHGEIALGLRRSGGVELAPGRAERLAVSGDDQIIVVSRLTERP